MSAILFGCSRTADAPPPVDSSRPAPPSSAPSPPPLATSAAPRAALPPGDHLRLQAPLAAAYHDGAIFVAGTEPLGQHVLVARVAAQPALIERSAALPPIATIPDPTKIEAFGGDGGFAFRVEWVKDRQKKQVLHRFRARGAEPLSALEPVKLHVHATACGTLDGVAYTAPARRVAPEDEYLDNAPGRALFVRFSSDPPLQVLPSPQLARGLGPTGVLCGPHRVVISDGSDLYSLWAPGEPAGSLLRLPKYNTPYCPTYAPLSLADDTLFEARTDCRGELEVRSRGSAADAKMQIIHGPEAEDGPALEGTDDAFHATEVSATRDFAALVGVRQLPSAEVAPWDSSQRMWLDQTLEAMVLDRKTGRALVATRELARWLPRRKIGDWLVTWLGSRLIVAWVRGKDGFGYAVIDPASATVARSSVDVPEAGVAFAGCDTARCYAIALEVGERAPEPEIETGIARIFAFPAASTTPPP